VEVDALSTFIESPHSPVNEVNQFSASEKKAYIASLMSVITGLSLTLLIGLAGFFVGLIPPLIIGPITFKVASRDRELREEFRRVKEEAEWYGIE